MGPTPKFMQGSLVEVIQEFTSDEKELSIGKLEDFRLLRRQQGKITSIDDEGNAFVGFPAAKRTVFICKSKLVNLRLATPYVERPPASRADMRALGELIDKQQSNLTNIHNELKKEKRKTSCWAWWVFPTEKEGEGTRVTTTTAAELSTNASTVGKWRQVLETICDLIEANGKVVLPQIDHGRVHWFIKFWSHHEDSPQWMQAVCKRLDNFEWLAS